MGAITALSISQKIRDLDLSPAPGAVSDLLRAWGKGDAQAGEDLVPLVYRELRRRAAAYLRNERRDHTLQPTALVAKPYDCEILSLDQALNELAGVDARKAEIVELRYFGGLSEDEVATLLSLSRTTVTREWQAARQWLYRRMTDGSAEVRSKK